MTREKRSLENDEDSPQEKRQKVPQLASVIVEALKMDSLQRLCSSLEPIIRRVVSEEVERALARLAPANFGFRSSPKRVEGPDGKNLRLQFRSRLSLAVFTGGKVEGEQGAAIHVVLLDANTGQVITTGPESLAKLDVVVLEGDFNNDEEEDWTQEDFRSHEVREREGKRPLLTGDLQVTLKDGVGTLGDLIFTDNSSWIRSRKFRLGVKVASGYCEGIRIREATTEAFTVKDHRGELYKKHYPPVLHDEVWRLDKIGKDGAFHKKLNKAGIQTVEDFLRLVVRDPQRLRNILGSGMSNKMWESTVEHAKTCVLGGKLYVYYADQSQNFGVIFNNIYEFRGIVANGQYGPAESLSDNEKVFVDALLKKAYDNWMNVVEYDGEDLISLRSNKKGTGTRSEASIPIVQSVFNQQAPMTCGPVAMPLEQGAVNINSSVSGVLAGSVYNEKPVTRYIDQPKEVTTNNQLQFGNTSFGDLKEVGTAGSSQQNTILRTDAMVGLALGPPQTVSTNMPYHSIGSVMHPGNMNVPADWSCLRDNQGADGYTQGSHVDDYFSIDDIRSRSIEMLENDDMQQLLRMFSIGTAGVSASNESHDTYSTFTPSPNYSFGEVQNQTSGKAGKAVVGWLKLKAALRWGIFIRKIAAEKRAQLEELE